MPHKPCDTSSTLGDVAELLIAAKRIGIDELERIVQHAHECDLRQTDDPPEPFPVTRQALRMFWHFRCNLDSVEVTPAHG